MSQKKIYHYDKDFAAQAQRQDKTGVNMLYII